MLDIPTELPIPKNEADFEKMCAHVYGVVFEDKLPKINGRKGQSQRGVDVYVSHKGHGKIGIQCKKYHKTKLTLKHVEKEVAEADAGNQPISCLLIATTSPSDAKIQQEVQRISDERTAAGKFDVTVDFWDDIENRIFQYPILQERYAPHSAGGMFYRVENSLDEVKAHTSTLPARMQGLEETVGNALLSQRRDDSLNKFVSDQLDRANELIKAGRFRDALDSNAYIGRDQSEFDEHQKARWVLQRGVCLWLSKDDTKEASRLFAKAYELYPNDPKMAAARIRGLMLAGDNEAARKAGQEESERFPLSPHIWVAAANARIKAGEKVVQEDAPPEIREDAETFHILAISYHLAGDPEGALKYAEKAALHESSGFFARGDYLGFVLEDCARDPVLAFHGLLPTPRKERLQRAANLFAPRSQQLWSIQSSDVSGAVANLGFALLMLGDARGALDLVREARGNGLGEAVLFRIEMQALDTLERRQEALRVARENTDALSVDGYAAACEMAAAEGDVGFVSELLDKANERFPDEKATLGYMSGLLWGATAKSGDKSKAAELIRKANLLECGGIDLLCQAAPLMRWVGRVEEADSFEAAALSKIGPDSAQGDVFVVAETLFVARKWKDASVLYERLLERGENAASKIHARLLACYVETNQRRKAKALIQYLPDGWIDDEELRRAAMDIGQMAGDWQFLRPLAQKQLEKFPKDAASWLFWMAVLDRIASPPEFQSELLRIPSELSGADRNVAGLACLEIKYGQTEKGLGRFYRLIRSNPDNPDLLSSYLLTILTSRISILENAPDKVQPGCCFVVESEDGNQEKYVIDPEDCDGLPDKADFHHPESEFAGYFLGRSVGDELSLNLSFGVSKRVRVVSIVSAHIRLLELAQERAAKLEGLPNVQVMKLGKSGDAQKDLAPLFEMLRGSSSFVRNILNIYSEAPITLSKLSELLGRSPVDMCQGWPDEAPPLFVSTGANVERQEAEALIRNRDKKFVADSFALIELAMFESDGALECLGEVIISNQTKEYLERYGEQDVDSSDFGTAYDAGDRIGFVEHDGSYRARKKSFGLRLRKIVSERCRVEPVYGDLGDDEVSETLSAVVGNEAREALILAKEHGAVLLTLDGKLRAIAKRFCEVDGIWPHVLVPLAVESGFVSIREGIAFAAGAFLHRRTFVSLSAESILWMLSQGNWSLQRGIGLLKTHFSNPETELDSVEVVLEQFLELLVERNPQLGAYSEIMGHLVEAVLRRPDFSDERLENIGAHLDSLLRKSSRQSYSTPFLRKLLGRDDEGDARLRFLFSRIREARELAKNSERNDAVKAQVLFCCRRPTFAVVRTPLVSESVVGDATPRLDSLPKEVGNSKLPETKRTK